MKRLLSISGGGLRGIIPCCGLIELERQLGGVTRDHFDYVAGTSTGAMLAAGIAAGVPASQALSVYTEQGPRIFSPTNSLERDGLRLARGFMFDNQVLHSVVTDTLGASASLPLNSLPIKVLITSVAMDAQRWYFVQDGPKNAQTTGKYRLADVAVASAVAPTYHGPWLIPGLGWFFDGGAGGLSNPVHRLAIEAFYYDTFDPENTRIVSLGTGYYKPPSMPEPPDDLLATIQWVTNSLVSAAADEAAADVQRSWPGILQQFNPALPSAIDEADVAAIPQLVQIGQEFAKGLDWKSILGA